MSDVDPSIDGALAGVRVVEFAQNAAVPQCGRLFAGMGADVVKVEPPTGDSMRALAGLAPNEGRAYATINPGKRAMVLDLTSPDALEVIDGLLDWADVCLVGLKADDVERYGLGWDRIHARHPRLVQLVLTAFGPEGPDAGEGGYDVLVQARSGLGFSMNRSADGVPTPTRPAFIDFATGAVAATGVLAALRLRDQTGVGRRVDTSLLGAAMTLGTPVLSSFDADATTMDDVAAGIDVLRAAGADFDAQRDLYESQVVAGAGVFRIYFRHYLTADGLISIAGMSPALIGRFHEITGLARPPSMDPTTAEFQAVVDDAEALFASESTDHWLGRLRADGYPCSRYNLPYEAITDPQILANDYVVDLEHPTFGGYRTVGMPFTFDAGTSAVTKPSPRLGEHTFDVLRDLGFDDDAVTRLRGSGTIGEH